MISRRSFFTFAVGIIAAPAIVKVSGLMPMRGVPLIPDIIRAGSEGEIFAFATQGMDREGYEAHLADMAEGRGLIARRDPRRMNPWMKHLGEIDPYHPYFQGGSITQAPDMVYRT